MTALLTLAPNGRPSNNPTAEQLLADIGDAYESPEPPAQADCTLCRAAPRPYRAGPDPGRGAALRGAAVGGDPVCQAVRLLGLYRDAEDLSRRHCAADCAEPQLPGAYPPRHRAGAGAAEQRRHRRRVHRRQHRRHAGIQARPAQLGVRRCGGLAGATPVDLGRRLPALVCGGHLPDLCPAAHRQAGRAAVRAGRHVRRPSARRAPGRRDRGRQLTRRTRRSRWNARAWPSRAARG